MESARSSGEFPFRGYFGVFRFEFAEGEGVYHCILCRDGSSALRSSLAFQQQLQADSSSSVCRISRPDPKDDPQGRRQNAPDSLVLLCLHVIGSVQDEITLRAGVLLARLHQSEWT